MAVDFDQPTKFLIHSLKIDDNECKAMVYQIDIFQHVMASAVTGTISLVETSSNSFLADKHIEGNERITIDISSPGQQEGMIIDGYLNKIYNRIVTPNGQATYMVEFTTSTVRQNENIRIQKRYKNQNPEDVVKDVISKINKDNEIPVPIHLMNGGGYPMNFISGNWRPTKVIEYVQKNGQPTYRTGTSSANKEKKKSDKAGGTGSFFFWETLQGYVFASSICMLAGLATKNSDHKLDYSLATAGGNIEESMKKIISFDVQRNNDYQTQQRAGAFKSKSINFDMDTGVYYEQIWESEFATDKQKEASKGNTRIFMKTIQNEAFSNECLTTPFGTYDKTMNTLQQSNGTAENILDGIAQFQLPIRTDILPGDVVDTSVYQASEETANQLDQKHSGRWIVSGVSHTFTTGNNAAYTKLSCMRCTNQQDDVEASKNITL